MVASRVKRIHYENGKPIFGFTHYHYKRETYENCLTGAGFSQISWPGFVFSKHVDADYWNDYLDGFSITVLTAVRE